MTFARKLRSIPTPQLTVGLVGTLQVAAFCYLQFLNHVQTLEMHFVSSTLWGVVCLALAVTIAELSRPLSSRPLARWVPPAVLVAVPLAYETYPHVPAFGWFPIGAALAGVPVVCALLVRLSNRRNNSSPSRVAPLFTVAVAVTALAGSLLVLTVAPSPHHAPLAGIAIAGDPSPAYAGALGGNESLLIDMYQITAELPSFVGNATYRGEQLLMWYPYDQIRTLTEPVGMYHGAFNSLPAGFPILTAGDVDMLATRRPAEMLLLSTSGARFETALAALSRYHPVLVRTGVIREGPLTVHAWLIALRSFARQPL
jgi:hypothetical protein